MRIEHLRYLLEIDKRRSISAAAQELYLEQTTLSAIVKKLEQKLGFSIFKRMYNGVQTTPDGKKALAIVRDINCLFEEIKQLDTHSNALFHPVLITTSPTISSALTLPLTAAFLEEQPLSNLVFRVVPGDKIGPMIIKNDGNIGITYFLSKDLEKYRKIAPKYQVEVDFLLEDSLYLLISKDHPLARFNSISCAELEHLNFAMLSHYSTCKDSLVYFESFSSNNRHIIFPNIGLIKQAVVTGKMVAILSGYAIHYNHSVDNSRLKSIMLTGTQGENKMYLGLINRVDNSLSFQEKIMLQCIKTHFNQLELF